MSLTLIADESRMRLVAAIVRLTVTELLSVRKVVKAWSRNKDALRPNDTTGVSIVQPAGNEQLELRRAQSGDLALQRGLHGNFFKPQP